MPAITDIACCSLFPTDNFHLIHQGGPSNAPRYLIQRINNQNQRLHANSTTTATQQADIPTTSAATIWVAEIPSNNSTQFGLKFYTEIILGPNDVQRWYLRANAFGTSVDLVRSDDVSVVILYC